MDDETVVVRAVPEGSGAGDEGQVGEAVDRRLRLCTRDRPGAVDLVQDNRISRLFERKRHRVRDHEADVEGATRVVDDDLIAGAQLVDVREDTRASKRVVDVPGDQCRAARRRDRELPRYQNASCQTGSSASPIGASMTLFEVIPTPITAAAGAERRHRQLQRNRDRSGVQVEPRRGECRGHQQGGEAPGRECRVGIAARPV